MERANMELWTSIPGYEGFYEISSLGNARSLTRFVPYGRHQGMTYKGKDLKLFVSGSYLSVKLARAGITRTVYVHELVLLAFAGPRPVMKGRCEIRHLNGDKFCNVLPNLTYGTPKENQADRKLHKLGLVAIK